MVYNVRKALVTLRLYGLLQLHRIAVEQTLEQRFMGTLDTIPAVSGGTGVMPKYVVTPGIMREGRE